jgi:hypothetical protein
MTRSWQEAEFFTALDGLGAASGSELLYVFASWKVLSSIALRTQRISVIALNSANSVVRLRHLWRSPVVPEPGTNLLLISGALLFAAAYLGWCLSLPYRRN